MRRLDLVAVRVCFGLALAGCQVLGGERPLHPTGTAWLWPPHQERYTTVVNRTQSTITVAVELPRELVGDADETRLGAELRALWAVEQVRLKRCGVGKGAELARLPRAAFMRLLGDHGVAVIDYPREDLREELRTLDAP
jgi:predicted HTH domain antitoxin